MAIKVSAGVVVTANDRMDVWQPGYVVVRDGRIAEAGPGLGPDGDFGVDLHWRYDTKDVIQLANALEHVNLMWIEDPVPPDNPDAMARVTHAVNTPICTGENLYTRQGFRRLLELQGCDVVHIDIPKSGGLLESKRISDFADMYGIWTAAHNPASPVGTIASASMVRTG